MSQIVLHHPHATEARSEKAVGYIHSLSLHERVLQFISLISSQPIPASWIKQDGIITEADTSYHIIREIFTTGNCGNFAAALFTAFPGAVLYGADSMPGTGEAPHIITQIGGRFYDIDGCVDNKWFPQFTMTFDDLYDSDYIDNYSFGTRGPII